MGLYIYITYKYIPRWGLRCFKNCSKKKVYKWRVESRFSYMCEWWKKALPLDSPWWDCVLKSLPKNVDNMLTKC